MPFGFITKREHDKIVAAKDAEIARIGREREGAYGRARTYAGVLQSTQMRNTMLSSENDELARKLVALEARLAPFIAPRKRGDDGRFLPTHVGAQTGEVA